MGKVFEEMALRNKLALMLSVFAIGFIWVSFGRVSDALDRQREGTELIELANLSATVAAVVHELQTERALTAGYIGSGGNLFARDLSNQRRLTDEQIAVLTSQLAAGSATTAGAELALGLKVALADLNALGNWRAQVSEQQVDGESANLFYSDLNRDFLNIVELFPRLSTDGRINNSGSAFAAFLQSKESAALEAAILTRSLVQNAITSEAHDQLQSTIAAEQIYLGNFQKLATAAQNATFAKALEAPAFEQTLRMRAAVFDKPASVGFDVSANEWLRVQAEKLEVLNGMGQRLATDLRAGITELHGAASSEVRLIVLASLGMLIYAAVFGFAMSQTILSQLGADPQRLKTLVDSIANDGLELQLDELEPATGVFADVLHMHRKLQDRIKADREVFAENSRIRQALNNVDGNVMIVDNDDQIVYMNDAIESLFAEAQNDIRKDLPEFDVSALPGSNIDSLGLNDAGRGRFIEDVLDEHVSEVLIGGRTMKIVVNPVTGENNTRIGSVIEWTDRTQEVAMENEVHHVVGSALAGDLGKRIAIDDKTGFFRQVSETINQLVDVAERVIDDTLRVLSAIAGGNLDETIDAEYQGSFGELKHHANATVQKLTEVVGGIRESAALVKTGVEEISQGNLNLSQRTEEQAASLEETAASMEQMTTTVRQNAQNAVDANQLAQSAREQAENGGDVVSRAVRAMREINDSSRKISDIIGVIDEIAFQTNLLALNASVEAARAGEQGRGFAVVASEVRNLAGRSATAAREIKALINDSGGKVEEGSRLVNKSGAVLEDIVKGVQQVTDIVGEIAAASQEQSTGISEVCKSIMQMDELTQQNAALVEEAAAASESLGGQANDLNRMMAFFQSRAVRAPSQPAHSGPERRAARRPWNDSAAQEKTMAGSKRHAVGKLLVDDFADQEWEEF